MERVVSNFLTLQIEFLKLSKGKTFPKKVGHNFNHRPKQRSFQQKLLREFEEDL